MAVMGDLADLDVGSLLQMFGSRRASGRLRIAAAGDEVGMYLQEGRLVVASSARLPLRLGRVFQRRGMLSTSQLHVALRQQETEGRTRSLGHVLIDRGWVTPAQLASCVEEQGISALTRVLAVDQGTFVFDPGVPLPAGIDSGRLNTERLLLEATRRVDEMFELRNRLPPLYAPLTLSCQTTPSVEPVNVQEERVVGALLAGAGSLAELLDLLPIEERILLRTVLDLMHAGLVVGHSEALGVNGEVSSTSSQSGSVADRLLQTPMEDETHGFVPLTSAGEIDCLFPMPTEEELKLACDAAVDAA